LRKTALLPIVKRYFESDPPAAAHALESLGEDEAADVLKHVPAGLAAAVIRHLHDSLAARLLQRMPFPAFREIMQKLAPDQRAAIFFHFPGHVRELSLMQLDEKERKQLQEYLTYPADSAGRMMSTEFLAFHSDLKVKDVVDKLREIDKKGSKLSYAYVIDREQHLAGVINMRDMIVAQPQTLIETIMRKEVFAVDGFMDRESVAAEMAARKYFAVPVVDSQRRLLGVVRADDLIGGMNDAATEDFQKMFGAGGDERSFSPVSFSLKKRLPWLHVNLATAFLAAGVIALFEGLIAQITILAVFLPVVAGQGGNAGAQSLAVVMRGLVMREIPSQRAFSLVLKETWIGVVNGVVIGIVTGAIAWLWGGNPYLGLVIALGMMVTLVVAGMAGAAIPLGMKALGLDPAQCSNIILTTVTDVMGFFSFLGFAVLFKDLLV
jgi:magnesium transporter